MLLELSNLGTHGDTDTQVTGVSRANHTLLPTVGTPHVRMEVRDVAEVLPKGARDGSGASAPRSVHQTSHLGMSTQK